MKKIYERPVIIKNISGFANKFGMASYPTVKDQIDGVAVKDLTEKFGSPLFVFSERKIRERFRRYRDSFRNRYQNFNFAWSYKTNYLQTICAIYHQEGAIAEVVSDFEYEKAKKLGIEPDQIIFNGPHKDYDTLVKATKERAKIHIDHFDELLTLEKISDKIGVKPKVAIRINMDTGIYPMWSRFGFNFENGEAKKALDRIVKGEKFELEGLHTHIGTFILSPDAYKKGVDKIVSLYHYLKDNYQLTLKYLDFGGGFPSQNRLKAQYLPSSVAVPSIDSFIETISEAVLDHFSYNNGPKIYLETGRGLIDEAGYLITTTHATKRLPDGRRSLVVDAGVNLLFTSFFYDIPLYPAQEYYGTLENTVVYGPLCMNIDIIRDSIQLPHMVVGDQLVIHPVGAYGVTQWMQFINMRPAVVIVGDDGKIYKIRRKEELEDVERAEILPEKYRLIEEDE